MDFTLNLTSEETNIILNSLSKEPYHIVFGIIEKITRQATEQQNKSIAQTEKNEK